VRLVLLVVALVFIAGFGLLTALDIAGTGLNWLDALATLVLVLFATGIVGALLQAPRKGADPERPAGRFGRWMWPRPSPATRVSGC
jgi:hypothetical protein